MDFILFSAVISFVLLVISFAFKMFSLGLISSMAIMVVGIALIVSGVTGLDTILADNLGIIYVCLGAYVFINGSLEQIEEYNFGGRIEW